MGNPHFIIKVADIATVPTSDIGPAIASHPSFPHGTNVGFVQMITPGHIRLRTYERGAGETHACGSNACAAVAAGIIDGSLNHAVIVEYKYGQLVIEWEGSNKPVHMTGPAAYVYTGEWRQLPR
jgi:diaminopimelate epimerase